MNGVICNDSDQTKVRFTVDLVIAARRHLSFLKTLSDSTLLHHTPTIRRSIRRYEVLWMPLIADLSKGFSTAPLLLPPLDVQWVWHCHCLSPVSYRDYCASRYGCLVERPAIFDDENEDYAYDQCREIWSAKYPSEPFDPESDQEDDGGGVGTADNRSPLGEDLFATVTRHRTLCSHFSDPFVSETVYLKSARNRYMRFLYLAKRVSDACSRMVPTADILLMWLTHQSFPGAYGRDLEGMGTAGWGRRVAEFGELAGAGEVEETKRAWEEAFDEPYETAGAVFEPANSPSRVFFHQDCSDSDVNRKYKALHPRFLMEVWLLLKGQWEGKEVKDARKKFLRLRTLRCHREMKIDNFSSDLSSTTWRRTWHLYCEFGTRGLVLELRRQGSNILGNRKLIKTVVFLWNELLRSTCCTITRELQNQVRAMASVTPPVQAPYLLKCVPDRVTDDKGAMISDVVLRMNNYHPQEGRWLSRTVLDHAGRECFMTRIRIGEGFWRRGAETPRAVKWVDRIIEVREGSWSYIASSVGIAPQKVVGTAMPKEEDPPDKKATWCLSTGDVLTIQWEDGLSVQLENKNSNESARLLLGRKLQYQVKEDSSVNKNEEEEEQFLTLIRLNPENPNGRATALLNWRLFAVEFLPEEDAVLVLLLCMCIVRTLTEIRGEDVGNLLVRRRVRETEVGKRDWGSVMVPSSASSSPHLKPWFWNACQALAPAGADDARTPSYKYSPADGKDALYKQGIMPI